MTEGELDGELKVKKRIREERVEHIDTDGLLKWPLGARGVCPLSRWSCMGRLRSSYKGVTTSTILP